MMTKNASAALLLSMISAAGAQVAMQSVNGAPGYARYSRPYLVKFAADEEDEGAGRDGERIRSYAKTHAGRYLVFASEGSLYRLDSPEQLQALELIHTSLQALGRQQAALSAVQRPLGEQQQALGTVQSGTRDAATQGDIGRAQGSVGRVQGDIGRQQGVIGRQQGILGVALYNRVQSIIDACLRDKSCVVVEAKQPA